MVEFKECIVCLENEWLTTTKCNHIICIQCLFKLPKDECPVCRRSIHNPLPSYLRQFMSCVEKKKTRLDIDSLHQFHSL